MIIGVTGYGGSGASACIAAIKEFENVQFYDHSTEFQILQQPDGITDLRYNLVESRRRLNINCAISRFLTMINNQRSDRLSSRTNNEFRKISVDYIEAIIDMDWMGKSTYDPKDLLNFFDKSQFKYINALIRRIFWLFNPNVEWPPVNKRFFCSITEDEFVSITKEYLQKIFLASGFDLDKPILLEQLFSLENPLNGEDYFDGNVKSIIVDRDPRDFYTLVTLYWSKPSTGYMPNDGDVDKFIKYYKGLHHYQGNDGKIKYVQFEDLIYKYEQTIHELEVFLGLKQINKKKFFKPELSVNNTQVYKKHPEIADRITRIEDALKEYLYPFEHYESNLEFERGLTGVFDDTPNDLDATIRRYRR